MFDLIKDKIEYYRAFPYEIKRDINTLWCNTIWRLFLKYDISRFVVHLLCHLEMEIKLFLDKELKDKLDSYDPSELRSEDPMYCSGCCFWDGSLIAYWLYGDQSSGYCHYLRNGDFSYINGTMLLWDGCRECSVPEELWNNVEWINTETEAEKQEIITKIQNSFEKANKDSIEDLEIKETQPEVKDEEETQPEVIEEIDTMLKMIYNKELEICLGSKYRVLKDVIYSMGTITKGEVVTLFMLGNIVHTLSREYAPIGETVYFEIGVGRMKEFLENID